MSVSVVIIIILSCALIVLLLGITLYCYRSRIGNGCGRIFHKKRKVHQITVPARPSGENEIVLAVTQRRENVPRNGSVACASNALQSSFSNNTGEHIIISNNNFPRPRPLHHHLVSRHHSFVTPPNRLPTFFSGSDVPSPLVSLSSLQSLLMSSQVAIFDSSTERLSLSSQNQTQLPFQSTSLCQQQQRQSQTSRVGFNEGDLSPFSISPAVSSSCVHLPQPSYFDEPPPTYQESMLIRNLRTSDRIPNSRALIYQPNNFNLNLNSASASRFSNSRRSCRT